MAVLGDTEVEPDETYFVSLTNLAHAVFARSQGIGTIINDDTNKAPSVALAALAPCLMLPTNLTLAATATDSDGLVTRVEFFDDGSPIGVSVTLPFEFVWLNVPPGPHWITAVAVDNGGERATSAPVYFLASFPSEIRIDDRTVVEGNFGITEALFTLTLSSASCHTVTVDVVTSDGTATAGVDYLSRQTNFVFLPGETTKTFSVAVLGDTEPEPNETYFVTLTNLTHAVFGRPQGLGTILNDDTNMPPTVALAAVAPCLTLPANLSLISTALDFDGLVSRVEFFDDTNLLGMCLTFPYGIIWVDVPAGLHRLTAVAVDNYGARATSAPVSFSASYLPELGIDDQSVIEGDSGFTDALFTLTLSSASCHTVSVDVVTFDRTAVAGADYLEVRTHLIFLPGETLKTVAVPVIGDTEVEPDETFLVCLTNVVNAAVARACGVGTIINDDTNKVPSVALAVVASCLILPTNIVLSASATDPDGLITRVEFLDHNNVIAVRSKPPFEFTWLNIEAGEHLVSAVAMDQLGARTTSAPVAFSASYPAALSINDQTVVEGNAGIVEAIFTIRLASASCHAVSVDVLTLDGTAMAGSDYIALMTNVVFLPGETQKSIAVSVLGDTEIEPDETFWVCLTNAAYATLARPCGLGTILNDDVNLPPTVTIVNPTNGAIFYTPPGIVPIEAEARDLDGFVTRVDFFVGGIFIGSDATMPYGLRWTNRAEGQYVLTAIATDNRGATGTSAPVQITIRACSTALSATPLQDQARCVCDQVIFFTVATSPEPMTFVWKFNANVLPGENQSSLVLQGLKLAQAGLYTVEISTPCARTSSSATLVLGGAGNQNPVSFTNSSRIEIIDHAIAAPYPSAIPVGCLPGPLKHISVTLDGLSHSFPDDVDILLVSPAGQSIKLMSDAGGNTSQKLTNVMLTFTDTATTPLPDSTRIVSGIYRPTDYGLVDDPFLPPAPQTSPATNFIPFIGTPPNGDWSLYVVDDQGGDAGAILRGWYLTIEWEDTVPLLTAPALLPDGRFVVTLSGLPHMTHVLEASTDMSHWTPVATNTLTTPSALLFDLRPGREPHRFYRAVRCP